MPQLAILCTETTSQIQLSLLGRFRLKRPFNTGGRQYKKAVGTQ